MVFFSMTWYHPSPSSLDSVGGSRRPSADDRRGRLFIRSLERDYLGLSMKPDYWPGESLEL